MLLTAREKSQMVAEEKSTFKLGKFEFIEWSTGFWKFRSTDQEVYNATSSRFGSHSAYMVVKNHGG